MAAELEGTGQFSSRISSLSSGYEATPLPVPDRIRSFLTVLRPFFKLHRMINCEQGNSWLPSCVGMKTWRKSAYGGERPD
jgi:hypothetical protein